MLLKDQTMTFYGWHTKRNEKFSWQKDLFVDPATAATNDL
jgi:hypothetical protein